MADDMLKALEILKKKKEEKEKIEKQKTAPKTIKKLENIYAEAISPSESSSGVVFEADKLVSTCKQLVKEIKNIPTLEDLVENAETAIADYATLSMELAKTEFSKNSDKVKDFLSEKSIEINEKIEALALKTETQLAEADKSAMEIIGRNLGKIFLATLLSGAITAMTITMKMEVDFNEIAYTKEQEIEQIPAIVSATASSFVVDEMMTSFVKPLSLALYFYSGIQKIRADVFIHYSMLDNAINTVTSSLNPVFGYFFGWGDRLFGYFMKPEDANKVVNLAKEIFSKDGVGYRTTNCVATTYKVTENLIVSGNVLGVQKASEQIADAFLIRMAKNAAAALYTGGKYTYLQIFDGDPKVIDAVTFETLEKTKETIENTLTFAKSWTKILPVGFVILSVLNNTKDLYQMHNPAKRIEQKLKAVGDQFEKSEIMLMSLLENVEEYSFMSMVGMDMIRIIAFGGSSTDLATAAAFMHQFVSLKKIQHKTEIEKRINSNIKEPQTYFGIPTKYIEYATYSIRVMYMISLRNHSAQKAAIDLVNNSGIPLISSAFLNVSDGIFSIASFFEENKNVDLSIDNKTFFLSLGMLTSVTYGIPALCALGNDFILKQKIKSINETFEKAAEADVEYSQNKLNPLYDIDDINNAIARVEYQKLKNDDKEMSSEDYLKLKASLNLLYATQLDQDEFNLITEEQLNLIKNTTDKNNIALPSEFSDMWKVLYVTTNLYKNEELKKEREKVLDNFKYDQSKVFYASISKLFITLMTGFIIPVVDKKNKNAVDRLNEIIKEVMDKITSEKEMNIEKNVSIVYNIEKIFMRGGPRQTEKMRKTFQESQQVLASLLHDVENCKIANKAEGKLLILCSSLLENAPNISKLIIDDFDIANQNYKKKIDKQTKLFIMLSDKNAKYFELVQTYCKQNNMVNFSPTEIINLHQDIENVLYKNGNEIYDNLLNTSILAAFISPKCPMVEDNNIDAILKSAATNFFNMCNLNYTENLKRVNAKNMYEHMLSDIYYMMNGFLTETDPEVIKRATPLFVRVVYHVSEILIDCGNVKKSEEKNFLLDRIISHIKARINSTKENPLKIIENANKLNKSTGTPTVKCLGKMVAMFDYVFAVRLFLIVNIFEKTKQNLENNSEIIKFLIQDHKDAYYKKTEKQLEVKKHEPNGSTSIVKIESASNFKIPLKIQERSNMAKGLSIMTAVGSIGCAVASYCMTNHPLSVSVDKTQTYTGFSGGIYGGTRTEGKFTGGETDIMHFTPVIPSTFEPKETFLDKPKLDFNEKIEESVQTKEELTTTTYLNGYTEEQRSKIWKSQFRTMFPADPLLYIFYTIESDEYLRRMAYNIYMDKEKIPNYIKKILGDMPIRNRQDPRMTYTAPVWIPILIDIVWSEISTRPVLLLPDEKDIPREFNKAFFSKTNPKLIEKEKVLGNGIIVNHENLYDYLIFTYVYSFGVIIHNRTQFTAGLKYVEFTTPE